MNSSKKAVKSTYRADIDGIRAVAVLSVFLFHLHPQLLPGGFLGVDVFFVISGYLITNIIIRENHTGEFSFIHFYTRRVKRIFPALFVVLFLTAIVATFLLAPETYINFMRSSRYAAGQLSNFFFAREVSYFAEGFTGQPLLHTWSLGVEEQFYLFWPMLIFVSFYFLNKARAGKSKQYFSDVGRGTGENFFDQPGSVKDANRLTDINRKFAWILLFLSALSYGACYTLAASHHNLAFYMFYARAWEFCLGAFVALHIFPSPKSKISQHLIGTTGFILLCMSFILITEDNLGTSFLRFGVIMPCLGTAILIHVGGPRGLANGFLASKLPVFIGRISYSLYLYHWPVIILWKIFDDRSELGPVASFGILAVSLLLATLSYLYVEQPVRKSNYSGRIILTCGFAVIAVFAFTFKQLESYDLAPWRIERFTTFPPPLENELPDGCALKFAGKVKYFSCDFNKNSDNSAVALVGDSHSPHYFEASAAWTKEKGYDLVFLSTPGCPMLLGDIQIESKLEKSHEQECKDSLHFFKKYIVNNPRVKLILLSQRFDLFYNGKGYLRNSRAITFRGEGGKIVADHTKYYQEKFGFTVNSIREQGKEIMVLKQVPLMKDVKSCDYQPLLKKLFDKEQICRYDSAFIDKWQTPSVHFIDDLTAKYHVATFDPTPYFKTPVQNGINLYHDPDHLNRYGDLYMVDHFGKAMTGILDQIPKN